jgi:predicted RNA binding protein YcfA (HicA-like mRNA interferase family)
MPRLPVISGWHAVAAFQRAGFEVTRQRGSHVVMTKTGFAATLSVPDHHELKPGTLRALIRKAGLTVDQFEELLRL